mmetsp:Transcript_23723/g.42664  ORF Transcript_23723/g.42664 Transcript_23723/m.42664 type:complete len:141 (+) Transcript_23723:138-560(+)
MSHLPTSRAAHRHHYRHHYRHRHNYRVKAALLTYPATIATPRRHLALVTGVLTIMPVMLRDPFTLAASEEYPVRSDAPPTPTTTTSTTVAINNASHNNTTRCSSRNDNNYPRSRSIQTLLHVHLGNLLLPPILHRLLHVG